MSAVRHRHALMLTLVGACVLLLSVAFFPALESVRAWLQKRDDAETARLFAPYQRYHDLTEVVRRAARSSDNDAPSNTKPQALELLRLATSQDLPADFWNRGNALHYGHILLGRCALAAGEVATAGQELLLAADAPTSPQLSHFGPDMTLAEELLSRGQKAVVLEYLSKCQRLWHHPNKGRLDEWRSAIERGTTPAFGSSSGFHSKARGAA